MEELPTKLTTTFDKESNHDRRHHEYAAKPLVLGSAHDRLFGVVFDHHDLCDDQRRWGYSANVAAVVGGEEEQRQSLTMKAILFEQNRLSRL
jgi:hypothetical protein